MKKLIWATAIIVNLFITVIFKEKGISGAIPMVLLYGGTLGIAALLSKKFDDGERADAQHQSSDEADVPKKENKKRKFCSRCGSEIDINKVCTGCGKKYFKGIKLNKNSVIAIILILALVSSIAINIIQKNENTLLTAEKTALEETVEGLEEEISGLEIELQNHENLEDFIDDYVVFVEDDGTELYHKYECERFVGNEFWVYNFDAAQDEGYRACPVCH